MSDTDKLVRQRRELNRIALEAFRVERTPIGDQHVILGAERDPAGLARKLAAEPLKPDRPQEACDHGLFGDGWKQTDLVDLLKGGGNAKSQSTV